jgi:tetratricopeptide (TPR) repeat protein
VSTTPQLSPAQENARQLRAQGTRRLSDGDLEGARRLLTQAVEADATPAEGHYLLGNCLRRLRLPAEAESAFKAALERDPDLTAAWFSLAFLYEENGRWIEAAEQLRRLSAQFTGSLDIQHQAGGLMGEFGLHEDAARLYEAILKREPQARNHLRLGQYYQKLGRYADANRAFTAALDLNPDAGAAYLLLANSRRFSRTAEDQASLKRFTQAVESGSPSRMTRICLNFALGKIHDDLDEYDKAFGYFAEGNRLRHAELPFIAEEWLESTRQVESMGADLFPAARQKAGGTAPLFIVGMLRSGTTLTERILASHPQVSGLGERHWLAEAVQRATALTGQTHLAALPRLDEAAVASLRQEYLRHWPKDGRTPVYRVDKNPLNFIYVGFIARLFPEARIVHCQRDPRDTALSVYFQNFAHPDTSFAYDLSDIAHFHNGYARMMRHWERVLPAGMMHTLRYEELVQDQEKATRALLEALGLPWDPACLQFEQQPDSISTASLWQARQPLYTQSVGRWRRYEKHLGPLLSALDQ